MVQLSSKFKKARTPRVQQKMTIAKRHVDVAELLGEFLMFTPHAADTDLFHADMLILNPVLLKDSIKECQATSNIDRKPGMAQRGEIHRVYARKAKELAALYPFIFSLENCLRHKAAAHYGKVFGIDTWWTLIRDKIKNDQNADDMPVNKTGRKRLKGVQVTPKFVAQLFRTFYVMSDKQLSTLQGDEDDLIDEYYMCLSLGSLFHLIDADWNLARGMFVSDEDLGRTLRKGDLTNWFKIIREARNELFHSRSIGDVAKVARACENTLDKLGFHLGDFDKHVAGTQITRAPLIIPRAAYHLVPPV